MELNFEELDRLTQELASLARAGLPMPQGLQQLSESLPEGRLRTLSGEVAQALAQGKPLSQALREGSVSTPQEFAALIECAEMSGDLRSILDYAVEHSRRIKSHRAAVITTLTYPAFVFATMIFSLWFVLNFIVPRVQNIFIDLGAELPNPTQWLVALSHFAHGIGGAGLGALVVAVIFVVLFSKEIHGPLFTMIGRLPGFSSLVSLSDTALFTKFLSRMLERGVPLQAALRAASLAVWLGATRTSLLAMSVAAEQGHSVGGLLGKHIPSTAAYLFRQGEERGDLPAACAGIADYCEDRFERLSKRAIAILEPAVLIVVALFVMAVLISVYLPLFNIPKIVGREV